MESKLNGPVFLLGLGWLLLSFAFFSQAAGGGLQLSEFVPNPSGGLETEWVELLNNSDSNLNLRHFKIGDELGWRNISDSDLYIFPNEYIILAQDASQFNQFYPLFAGVVVEPLGWQILNNSGGETIKLGDSSANVIDSFYYEAGFSDNRSWENYIDPSGIIYWGASFDASGSSPGMANSFFYPRTAAIDLSVSPDPFSPQLDIYTVIKYNPPEADNFELAIYDISGRRVKTFFESSISAPGEQRWDGRDDNGEILPLGIYIIYARVDGVDASETKKTVVIAR